jgi:hypothetical protein
MIQPLRVIFLFGPRGIFPPAPLLHASVVGAQFPDEGRMFRIIRGRMEKPPPSNLLVVRSPLVEARIFETSGGGWKTIRPSILRAVRIPLMEAGYFLHPGRMK